MAQQERRVHEALARAKRAPGLFVDVIDPITLID